MDPMKVIKIDRFFAWVLFASMTLFFISGYGMTKGIISSELAVNIHNKILPPIVIIAFTVHTWYAIHLAFIRWRIWNAVSKTFLFLFFLAFILYFGYINFFYSPSATTGSQENSAVSEEYDDDDVAPTTTAPTSTTNSATSSTTKITAKVFNKAELAKYDGKNGNPAYVAVDGVVYDMTTVFKNGLHYGHIAGAELSNAFYMKHAKSAIIKYPAVGTYQN